MINTYKGTQIESTLSGWFIVRTFSDDYQNRANYSLKFDTWEGVTAYIDSFVD
jgi:hypothetical protein